MFFAVKNRTRDHHVKVWQAQKDKGHVFPHIWKLDHKIIIYICMCVLFTYMCVFTCMCVHIYR
jgi:hypothetical protein